MNEKFDTDYEMAVRSKTMSFNFKCVQLEENKYYLFHISFTSPLYHRIQALPHLCSENFTPLTWNNLTGITQSSC